MGGRASAASKNKWIAKAYDRINLTVPKGDKDIIQAHAEARGESVNGFIKRAIRKPWSGTTTIPSPCEGRRRAQKRPGINPGLFL